MKIEVNKFEIENEENLKKCIKRLLNMATKDEEIKAKKQVI